MGIFFKAVTPVSLKLQMNGEFTEAGEFIADLKSWRRKRRVRQVNLILAADFVLSHKVYIDAKIADHRDLAALLLREVEFAEPLRLQDLFYDYVPLESSLPDLAAYQLIVVKKAVLLPVIKKLKQAHLQLTGLSLQAMPEINLLPWRKHIRQKQILMQMIKLFLLPFILFISLFFTYIILQHKNEQLNAQIAIYYNQNLQNQMGERETLKRFMPAFNLLQQLPQGVEANALEYSHNTWRITGSLADLQDLAILNETLVKFHWLPVDGSVDVHQQDQAYLWQVQKAGGL